MGNFIFRAVSCFFWVIDPPILVFENLKKKNCHSEKYIFISFPDPHFVFLIQKKISYDCEVNVQNFKSSRSQLFFETIALKNFANFTGKHFFWSLYLIILFSLQF